MLYSALALWLALKLWVRYDPDPALYPDAVPMTEAEFNKWYYMWDTSTRRRRACERFYCSLVPVGNADDVPCSGDTVTPLFFALIWHPRSTPSESRSNREIRWATRFCLVCS